MYKKRDSQMLQRCNNSLSICRKLFGMQPAQVMYDRCLPSAARDHTPIASINQGLYFSGAFSPAETASPPPPPAKLSVPNTGTGVGCVGKALASSRVAMRAPSGTPGTVVVVVVAPTISLCGISLGGLAGPFSRTSLCRLCSSANLVVGSHSFWF